MQYYFEQAQTPDQTQSQPPEQSDFGGRPFVVDVARAALSNSDFRSALWTGEHLQLTVMSIMQGDDVGLEIHPHLDQMLYVVDGTGLVQMGDNRDDLYFEQPVFEGSAIFVPANTWHNLTNTGESNLVLYSVYAPPGHDFGTVHRTKADDVD